MKRELGGKERARKLLKDNNCDTGFLDNSPGELLEDEEWDEWGWI